MEFLDVQEMAREAQENTDSLIAFGMPFDAELKSISVGDCVKVSAEGIAWLWVEITGFKGDLIKGKVHDVISGTHLFKVGDVVTFERRHIFQITFNQLST